MTNAIQVFKDYPEQKYIPLVPVKVMTQVSPLHKVSVNVVQISINEDDRDVYKEKNSEFALTKKGLMKLMCAANIQIVESKSVIPTSCQRCVEMARATGKPVSCGSCECKSDIAWQVTIAVPDINGGFRKVTATREFICDDEKGKMSAGQYKVAFPFRSAHAESKALNRALREALMVKSTYKANELNKAFAVPVISPNFDDPALKDAMIKRFADGDNVLFGESQPKAIEAPAEDLQEIVIPADEPDPGPAPCDPFPEEPPIDAEPVIECHDCGAVLEPFRDPKGNEWTVERIRNYGIETYGKPLCARCLREMSRQQGGGGR